jgi:hypothetical protein
VGYSRRGEMRLLGALGVASCVAFSSLPVSADEIEEAKAAITKRLKDPESARFSDIVVKGNNVCGLVNAKNSMGGYVGPRPFVHNTESKVTLLVDRNEEISTNIVDSIVRPREDLCK